MSDSSCQKIIDVIENGLYPYMNTWQDYQRAVEDWTWKLRQAVAPNSLCPTCKFRDTCVINTNPYEVEFCASYDCSHAKVNQVQEVDCDE